MSYDWCVIAGYVMAIAWHSKCTSVNGFLSWWLQELICDCYLMAIFNDPPARKALLSSQQSKILPTNTTHQPSVGIILIILIILGNLQEVAEVHGFIPIIAPYLADQSMVSGCFLQTFPCFFCISWFWAPHEPVRSIYNTPNSEISAKCLGGILYGRCPPVMFLFL